MSHLNGFFLHEQMQHVYSCDPFEKSCSHKCHISMGFFFMNRCNMSFHVPLLRTSEITNVTFEWLFSSKNRCNMFIHVTLLRTAVVTNVTFNWLFFFMNRCIISFYVTLLRIFVITNVTFEWLFPS